MVILFIIEARTLLTPRFSTPTSRPSWHRTGDW